MSAVGSDPLPGQQRRMLVLLVGGAAAVVVGAGIRAASDVVAPVALALVVVIGVTPLSEAVRRHGGPRWLAAGVSVLAAFALVLVLLLGVGACVVQLAGALPQYAAQADELVDRANAALQRLGLDGHPLGASLGQLDLSRLTSFLTGLLGNLVSVLGSVFFLLAVMFFVAAEAAGFADRFTVVRGPRRAVGDALSGFVHAVRGYLLTTTVFGAVVAVCDGIALWLLQIPLPVVWALLSFLTNYVPNVGFVIGVVPPALLGLLDGGWTTMLSVIVVYSALNVVIQTFIQPRFVGDVVGLSATVMFLSLAVWGFLLGPLGALLAVPMTLLAKAVLLDADPATHWVGALIGAPATGPKDPDQQLRTTPPSSSHRTTTHRTANRTTPRSTTHRIPSSSRRSPSSSRRGRTRS